MTDRKVRAGAVEATAAPQVSNTPLREKIVDKQGRAYATGRRKDAVARVWLKPGTGKITINGRDQEVYFARPTLRLVIAADNDAATPGNPGVAHAFDAAAAAGALVAVPDFGGLA